MVTPVARTRDRVLALKGEETVAMAYELAAVMPLLSACNTLAVDWVVSGRS